LLRKGKREVAAKALKRLNGGIPGYDIERELQVMQLDLEGIDVAGEVQAKKASYFDLFRGTDLRRTLISFSILGWQQTIGIPVVFGYTACESGVEQRRHYNHGIDRLWRS
jgi:SP family general alpha glucoside:H+ symporter-like MFS transporter